MVSEPRKQSMGMDGDGLLKTYETFDERQQENWGALGIMG